MQITLYENFAKRDNSTLRPTTNGTVVNCALKNSTSISNPSFILTVENFNISYVKWDNRFYFVTNINSLKNGVIELSCTIDVLATYKTEILKTNAFVNFSSLVYNNNILDSRIGTSAEITSKTKLTSTSGFSDGGCYCITAIGDGDANLNHYYTYQNGLNQIAKKLSSVYDTDIINDLVLKFGSVVNAISNVMYIPFDTLEVFNTTIKLGSYDTGVFAWITDKTYVIKNVACEIPWINSNVSRRSFETIEIYLPYVGTINMNPELIKNDSYINISYSMDYITGSITYIINGLYTYSAKCGVPVALGVYQNDVSKMPVSLAFKASDLLSNAMLSSSISKLSNGNININPTDFNFEISNKISNVGTNFSTIGTMGGFDGIGITTENNNDILIKNTSHLYTDSIGSLKDTNGNPCFKFLSLSKLTGYCQCNGASVSVSCEDFERNKINNYLNTGFFIE